MASTPQIPIVNAGALYIDGLNLDFVSVSKIGIAAGQARDTSNENDILLSSAVEIDAAVNGANGLDSGSLANSTLYAVYLIGDSTSYEPVAGLLSASFSAPSLPAGYDMYRRIGAVRTNGSAQILDFSQRGSGSDRAMYYADAIATAVTAGAATTFTAIDLTGLVVDSAVGGQAILKIALTADAGATRTVAFRSGDSGSVAGQLILSSPASTVSTLCGICPYDAVPEIDYLVSNASAAVAVSVYGYIDQL